MHGCPKTCMQEYMQFHLLLLNNMKGLAHIPSRWHRTSRILQLSEVSKLHSPVSVWKCIPKQRHQCNSVAASSSEAEALQPAVGITQHSQHTLSQSELVPELAEQETIHRLIASSALSDEVLAKKAMAKAAARKARRIPPQPIAPPGLPKDQEQLLQAFSNGLLLIDKPLKWTSFDVCGKLRNMLKFIGVKKVGHAGTLDPLATGLLVVCTGSGTKFCDDFMAQDKEYSGVIRLGEGTATYDAEGDIIERQAWEHITDEALQEAAKTFVGDVMQVPPMYSALKVKGQKLYDLAREGVSIEREPRPVTITSFRVWRASNLGQEGTSSHGSSNGTTGSQEIVDDSKSSQTQSSAVRPGQDVHFHVACSKGTYVRSLAYDLGRALGTVAHLTALRRESVGELRVKDAWILADLLTQLREAKSRTEQVATE